MNIEEKIDMLMLDLMTDETYLEELRVKITETRKKLKKLQRIKEDVESITM